LKRWSRSGPKVMLVDTASATRRRPCDIGVNSIISLYGDHSSMIKFSESDRDGYEKVRDVVQAFMKNANTVIRARIQGSTKKSMCLVTLSTYTAELNLRLDYSLRLREWTQEEQGLLKRFDPNFLICC
jgi:hypothetical protein